jgi:hypothetical protein
LIRGGVARNEVKRSGITTTWRAVLSDMFAEMKESIGMIEDFQPLALSFMILNYG